VILGKIRNSVAVAEECSQLIDNLSCGWFSVCVAWLMRLRRCADADTSVRKADA